uniref:Serine protease 27-like n=1 Tax=Xenopus tropicalis TaxID=8364 RepID=A0A6I8SQE0_XENTR
MFLSGTYRTTEAQQLCGQRLVSSGVMGGQDSQPGMWPWQVNIRSQSGGFCGGSLITSKWVVSAAHCCDSTLTPSNYTVYAGSYNLSGTNPNEVSITVKNFIIHPNYTAAENGSDICLMELGTELNFTQYIAPVCLPASGVTFPTGLPCWVTGWGEPAFNVSLPSPVTLQQESVPLIGSQDCNNYYASHPYIKDDMICAGNVSGGKGSCQGDSGGPLVCAEADRWFLVGIVSFGLSCQQPNYPEVYGRINGFLDWITSSIPNVSANVLNVTFTGPTPNTTATTTSTLTTSIPNITNSLTTSLTPSVPNATYSATASSIANITDSLTTSLSTSLPNTTTSLATSLPNTTTSVANYLANAVQNTTNSVTTNLPTPIPMFTFTLIIVYICSFSLPS